MEHLFDQILSVDWWSVTLYTIDKVLFGLYVIPVFYLFIFASASLFNRTKSYRKATKQVRFATLFFIEHDNELIKTALQSFTKQSYPSDRYNLIVVFNPNRSSVREIASTFSVQLLETADNKTGKAEAIKYALSTMSEKEYDVVLIMNDNSTVESDYLSKINDAYYFGGNPIQTHRRARKMETDTALFGVVSEEINNSIFRKGHTNIGFSSGLIGSGMVIPFAWLKANIKHLSRVDLEKQLEELLLKQQIFIDYLEDVVVYEEKVTKVGEYIKERSAWIINKVETFKILFQKIPIAILRGNYDYCNKLFQWILPSRIILVGSLVLISLVLLYISWGMAIKWIITLLVLIVSFSIALPDKYIDARFIKALRSAPLLFLATTYQLIKQKIGRWKRNI